MTIEKLIFVNLLNLNIVNNYGICQYYLNRDINGLVYNKRALS